MLTPGKHDPCRLLQLVNMYIKNIKLKTTKVKLQS